MYDNNEFDNGELNNNESKTLNENINNEVSVGQNVEELPSTGFVLVDSPEKEESAAEASVSAEESVTENTEEDITPVVHGSEKPFSAKDIQPRKKTGLGKKIAALCLSGLLFGACAAGAYLGIMSLTGGIPGKQQNVAEESESNTTVKEPEIQEVEISSPLADGMSSVPAGVVYDVSGVVEDVMPAMVSIINNYSETYSTIFGQTYTQQSATSGSGIIIGENDSEIVIATNYHVISGSDEIVITFADATTATAYIKGSNPNMDLAVVSVPLESLTAETKDKIAVAKLGNSDALKMGQPVIAIGNALGYGQSVTTGVVSAIDREITNESGVTGSFIQTDAAINPGNSGGALLNLSGEVIGINSSKIGGSTVEGMGYAIPISAAEPIISDLSLQTTKIKVPEDQRGFVGISIREVSASMAQVYGMPQGVYITGVSEKSAAEAAGIKVHDIIVKFDTFDVESMEDLAEALQYYAAGTTVSIEVMRIQGNEYVRIPLELTLGKTQSN